MLTGGCNKIEAKSRLLAHEDLGRKDLDEFEDTDKDYMYNETMRNVYM